MEFIRVAIKMAKEVALESSSGRMEKVTREIGKMAKKMVMESGDH